MDAPAVAVSRDGKKFAVAWMDMRSGRQKRQVYWLLLDGVMSEKPLADDPRGLKGHPCIAMDDKGHLHAAWEDDRSGMQRIRYRALTTDGKDIPLSPEGGKASFPSLACGNVVGVAFEYGGDVAFTPAP